MKTLHIGNLSLSLAAPILIAALLAGASCNTKGEHGAAAQTPPPTVVVAAVSQKNSADLQRVCRTDQG